MNTRQILDMLDNYQYSSDVTMFLDRISWNKLAYHMFPDGHSEVLKIWDVNIYKVDVTGDFLMIGG